MSKIAPALLALTLTYALASPVVAADPSPAPSAGATEEKTVTTASGLQYVDSKVGVGPRPKVGQTAGINYAIYLEERKIAASTAGQPMRFELGKDQALKGLEEGVSTMQVGGKRKLTVPPSLGYGADGGGPVPGNATLVIDVELVEIK